MSIKLCILSTKPNQTKPSEIIKQGTDVPMTSADVLVYFPCTPIDKPRILLIKDSKAQGNERSQNRKKKRYDTIR